MITTTMMMMTLMCLRYKDGEVLPVEERRDVVVTMTRLENRVVSVLNIKNLSDQKRVLHPCANVLTF